MLFCPATAMPCLPGFCTCTCLGCRIKSHNEHLHSTTAKPRHKVRFNLGQRQLYYVIVSITYIYYYITGTITRDLVWKQSSDSCVLNGINLLRVSFASLLAKVSIACKLPHFWNLSMLLQHGHGKKLQVLIS